MVLTHAMYEYLLESYKLEVDGMIIAVHAYRFGDVAKLFPDAIPVGDRYEGKNYRAPDRMVCIDTRGNVTSDIAW